MKITVYRPNQIGGCITEITSAKGTRIIIDVGSNLPGCNGEYVGIKELSTGCDGVFITHYHGDHIGEYKHVHNDVDIYMGEVAKKIFMALQTRLSKSESVTGVTQENFETIGKIKTFKQGEVIKIKELTITPIRTDHSAFDSYMYLINDSEKRVLHTGDFRSHGKIGEDSLEYIEKNIGKVDALIVEGTMLSRNCEGVITEEKLSKKAAEIIEKHKYVFILCSSTNIDRIAAFYRVKGNKLFVTDDYQSKVLNAVTANSKEFGDYYDFSDSVSFDGDKHFKSMEENGFCMLIRNNSFSEKFLNSYKFKKNRLFIYSQWKGYLEGEHKNEDLAKLVPPDYEYLHTSGHATEEAIVKLCEIVKPDVIFPIHSENPGRFKTLIKESKVECFEKSGDSKEI
jgi:ribonuclease J